MSRLTNRTVFLCSFLLMFGWMSSPVWAGPAPDGPRDAWWYLERQVAFGPRNPGSAGHRLVRDFLKAELLASTDSVELQEFDVFYEGEDYKMCNISALFRSADGRSEPFVILGAHFDTRPVADNDPDPALRHAPIIGANDGGSGVAVLMEIAAILAVMPPPVPVMLVFFDGEDFGLSVDAMFLGSRQFTAKLDPSLVRYMILLDMVGDAELEVLIEGNSYVNAPWLVELVWASAASMGHGSLFPWQAGYWILDDHVPFIELGIPAIDIIDFDYPFWHTTDDTIDKCSRESLRAVRDVVLDVIFSSGGGVDVTDTRGEAATVAAHGPGPGELGDALGGAPAVGPE